MLTSSPVCTADELERLTGWHLEPRGLCRGDVCVPADDLDPERLDLREVAHKIRRPLVGDETHELWCLGPEYGGRALHTAECPDLVLPDLDGEPFAIRSLRGQKVFLLAWASW